MGKKSKGSKKRSQRRERAKDRADGVPDDLASQEAEADAAVDKAAEAAPETSPAREKKEPKAKQDTEEPREPAFERIKRFFSDVKIEALKINWPSTDETWKSTWVTVFVIIALSIFMGFCSAGFQRVSGALFGVNTELSGNPGAVPSTPIDNLGAAPPEEGSGDGDTE